jgi:hypothetical protein
LFWQDSWKQQTSLATLEELNPLHQSLQPDIFRWVKDIWKTSDRNLPWREWKIEHQEFHLPREMDLQSWRAYTNQWKISNRIGPNILIWGHSTSGIFSIKEAYYL